MRVHDFHHFRYVQALIGICFNFYEYSENQREILSFFLGRGSVCVPSEFRARVGVWGQGFGLGLGFGFFWARVSVWR